MCLGRSAKVRPMCQTTFPLSGVKGPRARARAALSRAEAVEEVWEIQASPSTGLPTPDTRSPLGVVQAWRTHCLYQVAAGPLVAAQEVAVDLAVGEELEAPVNLTATSLVAATAAVVRSTSLSKVAEVEEVATQ